MEEEHPLITAIRLKKKAVKLKAEPLIISNIEKRISILAKQSMKTMRKSDYVSNIIGNGE